MKKSVLKAYAKLIVKVGVNVQKGQDVIINCNVDDNYFVQYVVEECYKAHARKVTVDFISDEIDRLKYKYEKVESLSEFPEWLHKKWEYYLDKLPARIYIDSSDPDALNSIDQDKITEVRRITGPIIRKYRDQMDNKYQWTIVGIPGRKWAKKVFPELSEKKAIEKLWNAILDVTRVKGDAISNWELHNNNLKEKTDKLNSLKIKKLYYKNSKGTDFSIEIPECMIFESGSEKTYSGVVYNPNMPTEECFTSPDKFSANGKVYASKPLSVLGSVVSDFGFEFKDGKAIKVLCDKEYDKKLLEKLISIDEGASRLGEVALVPFNSPINESNILFYSTLYDENAVCHLALGRAFTECIKDYQSLSDEKIEEVPLNKSAIHVDFMIGTNDLKIVAETYDNKMVTIFENGVFAI